MYDYDLVIVGGGLVGGSLACALSRAPLKVALIEAVPPRSDQQPSYDERVIALSLGSRRIFDAMGVWPEIEPEAEPICDIHVSDRGHCGFSRLSHREEGVDALGYVAPARAMGQAIYSALRYAPNVEVFCPAQLHGYQVSAAGVDLDLETEDARLSLHAKLLVAADGGDSAVRRGLSLKSEERAYGHDAVITTVTPDRPRRGWAFERFSDSGPLAMLPMTRGRYSVVWTCRESETAEILGLSDAAFLQRLQARFGYRLGRLGEVAPRRAYPLKLLLTRDAVQERLVLIGNAAHTLHPVAGQGFNLGLRDVAALAEVLVESAARGGDVGAASVLADYQKWRRRDQVGTARLTDTLARLFVLPWWPVRVGRNLGMLGLDLIPAVRHGVAERFMGLSGPLPRLARGLSLEGRHV
ncbi:2-octaprenyl-6-methoxyphenyl hydroxylase [Thiorhodococcus mannitoliphagus]|uniref:2-octaprenyl-6-methoxyphenyl hydroxylase n=1 Tax=Thiorhodococcus mannitoliphagus TaxID=329406 RepID=A0A6P1DWA5_9GAMM|nr:2-octaprenyl-6-methoxyphenyl hydroxylase [Thiorhodococcus mannitoliphagus]NEX21301.1 2-octaprenyl-6-methoxyphenyl hydroxylase [Thiorhodococcus mannitoliphagus]